MTERVAVEKLLENTYEPIRRYRWLLHFVGGEIPAYLGKTLQAYEDGLSLEIYLAEHHSEIWDKLRAAYQSKDVFSQGATLKFLNKDGLVIEKTEYGPLKVSSVGPLRCDYSDDRPVTVKMYLTEIR